MFTPSPNQRDIFYEIKNGTSNVAVNAVAGSGKTTTIVESLKLIPYHKSCIFLAFNKSIVEELKQRTPARIEVNTLHQLGLKHCFRHFGSGFVTESKLFKLISPTVEKHFKALNRKYKKAEREKSNEAIELRNELDTFAKNKGKYQYMIVKMVNLFRLNMCSNLSELKTISDKYAIGAPDQVVKWATEVITAMNRYNKSHGDGKISIDFTDMVCLPVTLDMKMDKYDYVFVDECQDLNRAQQELVFKLLKPTSRLIAVGDPKQCQPEGTKILMQDGTYKNIENLKSGDNVISYETTNQCSFKGIHQKYPIKINKIASRFVNEDIIKIKSNGKTSSYTNNHRCIVRFTRESKHCYCLYLMRKGNWFRIGIAPLWSKKNDFASYRARQEKADDFWVLKIYDDKRSAFLDEQYYSIHYKLPQLRFKDNHTGVYNQKEINECWNRFDVSINLEKQARDLLLLFNKSIDYPIWSKESNLRCSKHRNFQIHASNLFEKYMEVPHFQNEMRSGSKKHYTPNYYRIDNLEHLRYSGKVYSLDVEKYHTYIADGIVTHNCIYGFAGSDVKSFERLVNRPNTKQLPLSVCYRCAKTIVEEARTIYDHIQPFDKAEEGVVRNDGSVSEITEGDFVLCRNTKPLVELYFKLLKQNKKAFIKGKDIGENLLKELEPFKGLRSEDALNSLHDQLDDLVESLKQKGISKPKYHDKYIAKAELVGVISVFLSTTNTANEAYRTISRIFKDDGEGIMLSTIHKSKGLEANRVFILKRELLPSEHATEEWQLEQERNLQYVMITRAKKELIYISE